MSFGLSSAHKLSQVYRIDLGFQRFLGDFSTPESRLELLRVAWVPLWTLKGRLWATKSTQGLLGSHLDCSRDADFSNPGNIFNLPASSKAQRFQSASRDFCIVCMQMDKCMVCIHACMLHVCTYHMDVCIYARMHTYRHVYIHRRTDKQTGRHRYRQAERRMNSRTGGHTDGRTAGRMHGRTARQIDRQTDRHQNLTEEDLKDMPDISNLIGDIRKTFTKQSWLWEKTSENYETQQPLWNRM